MDRKKNNVELSMEELLHALCKLSPGDWHMLRLIIESDVHKEAAELIAAARERSGNIDDIIRELAEHLRGA